VAKRRKPAESPVTRIGPVQNQLVRSRILDSDEQNEDASEGTYDGLKPTGMMGNDGKRQGPKAQQIRAIN
jgi:hypothetical protein